MPDTEAVPARRPLKAAGHASEDGGSRCGLLCCSLTLPQLSPVRLTDAVRFAGDGGLDSAEFGESREQAQPPRKI